VASLSSSGTGSDTNGEREQHDLAEAAQVTKVLHSQLLTGKKAPPAPEWTDIYDRMETFGRLRAGKWAKVADLKPDEASRRKLGGRAQALV
jgi:hypothetical protein